MVQEDDFTNLQRLADLLLSRADPPTDLISFLKDVRARNLSLQRAAREFHTLTGFDVAFSTIKNWTEKLLPEEVAS